MILPLKVCNTKETLVCGVFCEFVTFPLVSWVRCGTWLYRFLIFATLLLCLLKNNLFSYLFMSFKIWHTRWQDKHNKMASKYKSKFSNTDCSFIMVNFLSFHLEKYLAKNIRIAPTRQLYWIHTMSPDLVL